MTTHKNQEQKSQEQRTFTWNCIEKEESSQLPTVRLSPMALLLADLPFLASLSLHLLVLDLCCGLRACLTLAVCSPYSWHLLTGLVNLPIPAWKPWVHIVPLRELGRGVLYLLNTLSKWNCCFFTQLCLTVAPLSVGFRRQVYWSGLPFPSPWKVKYRLDFRQTRCIEENPQTFSETCVQACFQISMCSLWESPGTDSAESLIVSCFK